MKKRILSVLLAVFMLLPALAVTPYAEEKTVIPWNEPAIAAEVGTEIDFTDYVIQYLEGADPQTNIVWKLDGTGVKTFTPEKAGVTEIVAESGKKSKTIYIVAKEPKDTEYVLYYNDFESEDSLDGFIKSVASRVSLKDGDLIIDATGYDMVRATLPSWLGDFGNYSITASVMTSDYRDTSRWNSICYRASGASYPFYHMCVRKNCGTGSGVEFALRTPSNGWDVIESATHTVNQTDGKYYTYNVQVRNDIILHSIDGNPINYNDAEKPYQKGCIGLISNYSVMHVKYIKVALQLEDPRIDVPETLIVPTAKVKNITNAFANVAWPADPDSLGRLADAHSVVLGTDGTYVFTADGSKVCAIENVFEAIGGNIVPVFECNTNEAVDGVVKLAATQVVPDVSVLTADESVLAYARGKQPMIRGIIDLRGVFTEPMTESDIAEARKLINANAVKIGLFDSKALDASSADELRSMLLTVWAFDAAEDEASLLHAMLTGAHAVVTPSPDKVKEAYTLFAEDALTRTPSVIGHRGNPTNAPENSISSYRIAYENGADIVETDVYLSKDGEVVVMHDSDISRTTTGTGNIESLTLAQLKEYYLWGENDKFKTSFPEERIPTLREIFELMKNCEGLKLFVEIKTTKPAVCQKIVDLAEEYGMSERISVISFSLTQLVKMHQVAPEISCGYLLNTIQSSASDELAAAALNAVISSIVKNNITCNPAYTALTYKFLSAANVRGITVWPWTYTASNGERFAYAFKSGFGGLTTNDAQYTKNNVKYITAPACARASVGESVTLDVTAVTYGRTSDNVSDRVEITVISGADVIKVEGATVTGLKQGTAYVMCSYATKLPVGAAKGSYTVYTDVIRIDVSGAGVIVGDFDGDGDVDSSDAIYLLRAVLFSEDYPLNQSGDIDRNGRIDSADAIYLLRHVLFSGDYPLL
jgi:glycerophosphoryl diester phosphodiesterase